MMVIMEGESSKGKLYIVSTPIGNKDDITLRAINMIKKSDFVICEEMKMGAITLKNINAVKDLVSLNEHNEAEVAQEIIDRLVKGEKAALISDAGTPLIADPGSRLMKIALRSDIEIEVIPGVTSILTAIVRSGFPTDEFVFAGFVSRKTEEKIQQLKRLSKEQRTVILLETPYRLVQILESCKEVMPDRKAYIGMNLTLKYETHHYGTFQELYDKFKEHNMKSEFVICFKGSPKIEEDFRSSNRSGQDFNQQREGFGRDRGSDQPRRFEKRDDFRRDNSPDGENINKTSYDSRDSRKSFDNRDNKSRYDSRDDKKRYETGDKTEKKPYSDNREGGERRPYADKREGGERKPYSGSREGGERKPYPGNREGGERRPYADKREGGERKPYYDKHEGSERKPYIDRNEGSGNSEGYEKREFRKDRGDRIPENDSNPRNENSDTPPSTERSVNQNPSKRKPGMKRKGSGEGQNRFEKREGVASRSKFEKRKRNDYE